MSSDVALPSRLDELDEPDTEDVEPGQSTNNSSAPPDADVTEQLVKRKKARRSLNPDLLVGPNGFRRIYEEFPAECKLIEGAEGRSLRKLFARYRTWAFDLYPGLSFTDMLAAVETQSTKAQTRACLSELRDRERDRFLVSFVRIGEWLTMITCPCRER